MHEDPIVAETRKLREELMNEVGNDLDRLFDYLREREDQHAERLVSFAPRRVVAMRGVIADRKLED
ncbi:MAG TPA: hypothetical protein VNN25_25900 [Thermoanaerobaculia bacterium]|nr:hypothetical protein [Thermoanaerobaculia bacterium]